MRLAVLAAAAGLTAALAQTTTTAAFAAQSGNGSNQAATAPTFCSSPGPVTHSVVNDVYVDQSDPTTTKGGVTLVVRSGPAVAQVLLRFSTPSPPAQHCRLTGATLRLYAVASDAGGTLDVHLASGAWTSAATTWDSRPGHAGAGIGRTSGTPGWHEWDVTTLATQLTPDPNQGFLLKDRNEAVGTRTTTYESLDSTTVANRPQLVLTWG
jgi:hypothetical protein